MSATTINEEYERVANAPPAAKRLEFGCYCRLVISAVDDGELTTQDGAYRVCGTAARVLDVLSASERELMTIAGNLELPETQRDHSLPDWESFKKKVETLFPVE